MKLDILVLAAHPDDAEISCAGTIARHVAMGHKVGIVDFTKGELGTRGTVEIRAAEAAAAAKILGVSVRENLGLRDGFFENDPTHQLAVIRAIRKYQPSIVLANAVYDRHIDHGRGASLAYDACFLSGLVRIETKDENGKKPGTLETRGCISLHSEFIHRTGFYCGRFGLLGYQDRGAQSIQVAVL